MKDEPPSSRSTWGSDQQLTRQSVLFTFCEREFSERNVSSALENGLSVQVESIQGHENDLTLDSVSADGA